MTMSLDTSHATKVGVDLTRAAVRVQLAAIDAVESSAKRMEKDARRRVSGHPKIKHYPRAIGSEVRYDFNGVTAAVGVNKGATQGGLWNLIEYGSSKNAPIPHLNPALQAEAPKLAAILTRLARQVP